VCDVSPCVAGGRGGDGELHGWGERGGSGAAVSPRVVEGSSSTASDGAVCASSVLAEGERLPSDAAGVGAVAGSARVV
jgi:hypothetical protein